MERLTFLHLIEEFLKETGMSPTSFSKQVTGDPTYVSTLRKGRESKESKQKRIIDFIEAFRSEEKLEQGEE